MPIHDWSRVAPGIFHDFHYSWVLEIKRALSRGLLPPGYYVMAEQRGGDVSDTPPVRITDSTDIDDSARKQRTLVIRHVSDDRIIAMIEVLSPGNKASQHAIRSLLDKVGAAVEQGIHLLLIDVHPPTPTGPQGIHGAVWAAIGRAPYINPTNKPLTAVAYSSTRTQVNAYVEPLAVGEALPSMSLFLTPAYYVSVPLEAAYQAAWPDVPPRWQGVLEAP